MHGRRRGHEFGATVVTDMKPRRHRRGSDRVATVVPKSLRGLSGWAGSGTVERPGRGCHPGTLRGSGRAQAVPVRFPSRTAAALKDQFGLPVAAGTVAGWVKRTALGIIAQVLPVIARQTVAAPVAPSDQTGLRKAGRLAWLHSASTATDVFVRLPARRDDYLRSVTDPAVPFDNNPADCTDRTPNCA